MGSTWGAVEPDVWSVMPNIVPVVTGDEIYIRVTTRDGAQAVLSELEWCFDVEDAEYSIDSVDIPAEGARLSIPSGYFRWVKGITFGLEYVEGNTATAVRYLDKGVIVGGVVTQGPLVQCLDKNGVAVAGRIDARIQGAAGG